MPESLFSRATRYTRSPRLDPHENRLTEVTAAVLERVEGLAQGIAEALLEAANADVRYAIRPRSFGDPRRLDAEPGGNLIRRQQPGYICQPPPRGFAHSRPVHRSHLSNGLASFPPTDLSDSYFAPRQGLKLGGWSLLTAPWSSRHPI